MQFDQTWSNLIKIRRNLINLIKFDQIWSNLAVSKSIPKSIAKSIQKSIFLENEKYWFISRILIRINSRCQGFVTCRKSFCVAGAILLRRFQKISFLQFSWQAQHFGRVHRHFAWQAQHFRRVVLRVFCESHWQGCVKWRQGADSVASVAFCEMCWKLTEASHETSISR